MEQQEFDFGTPAYKLARADGPETSKAAAKAVNTNRMEQACYDIIESFGADGCISDQVRDIAAEQHGPTAFQSITCRYSGLIEKGLVVVKEGETKLGRSGRKQRVMRAARYA